MAIFLDRDGVLNKDQNGYVYKVEDFELLPGVIGGLKKLQNHYLLIIVTNQSGIGKGIYSLEDYKSFRNHMHEKLKGDGINIQDEYFCKHHPESTIEKYRKICKNRKPGVGMFKKAQSKYNLDFSKSWTVGDKPSDIEAGLAVGTKTIGIPSNECSEKELREAGAHFVVSNLDEAAGVILKWGYNATFH